MTKIKELALSDLNHEDKTFQFRANLRVGDLVKSIEQHGQQQPIDVRGKKPYQIVSGFRRVEAIGKASIETVKAIVHDDLEDDEKAYVFSYIENEKRKSYSDLDRGYAIVKFKEQGKTIDEISDLLGLSKRQVIRLKKITGFPKSVQEAIDDGSLPTTHALVLMQLREKYGQKVNLQKWIKRVKVEELSVRDMMREILAGEVEKPVELFVTDKEGFRFRPVRINPAQMDDEQVRRIVTDLEKLLKVLKK